MQPQIIQLPKAINVGGKIYFIEEVEDVPFKI
jgi:hypothetical protein